MRPERPDIAAPPFPPGIDWIGAEPPVMERLCAKGPVIVHFFEASEPSSFRSLDWVRAWSERYGPHGLRVIGVHTPRSGFARASEDLEAVVGRLGLSYPVANDAEQAIWRDYGCRGWPSLFLWRRGGVLEWVHFGEGEYQATEQSLRSVLAPAEERASLPEPIASTRASDAEGARVLEPSPEHFPGGALDQPYEGSGEALEIGYSAGASYAALSGKGEMSGSVDGVPLGPIVVDGPAMLALAEHDRHDDHRLTLVPSVGVRIWSVGFGAGVP